MALEPGSLVADLGVADGVGLVKGVVGKIQNLVVDLLGGLLRHSVGHSPGDIPRGVAVDEGGPLRLDDVHFLLAHGAADVVRLAHGVACQLAKDLNYLLLVDQTAIGDLQNWLQLGGAVADLTGVALAAGELRDGIHGAGAVEGNDGGQVLDALGWMPTHTPVMPADSS